MVFEGFDLLSYCKLIIAVFMLTLSSSSGIGGKVKSSPEDFIVMEITPNGTVLELDRRYNKGEIEEEVEDGKFTTFVLQKREWDTIRALREISKRSGRGKKSISHAGTKDKVSISVQLASVYGTSPERMENIHIKDIGINGAWRSNGVELGSNLGNRFKIKIRDIEGDGAKIENIFNELNGISLNYFDRQRFGSVRMNNFRVGMHILKNEFKEAALDFLTETDGENNQEAVEARKELRDTMDFKRALGRFPRYLKPERSMLDYLSKYENYANAIRKLPRALSLIFVHSVEALIFNAALQERVSKRDFESGAMCGENFYGFPDVESLGKEGKFPTGPLVGYETDRSLLGKYETEVMDKIGLNTEDFKIKGMPELSMKGTVRPLIYKFKDFSYSVEESDAVFEFSIPSGAYATILINEFTKSDSLQIEDIMKEL